MNRKTLINAIMIAILVLNFLGPVLLIADTDQGRPDPSTNYQVVSCYLDGTINYNHPAITVAGSDQITYSGALIKGLNISDTSAINSAVLSVYYWNNINWTTTGINVLIEGVYGSPDNLDWDAVKNGVGTPANVVYEVSAWDAGEGWFNITVTDILKQLILDPGYTPGDNFIFRFIHFPTFTPGDPEYNYQISTSVYPESNHRPILYVDYTPDSTYKGWTISEQLQDLSAIMVQRSDALELAILEANETGYQWNYYDLPDTTTIENYFTGTDQGVYYDGKVYMFLQAEGARALYAFNLTDHTLYNLGNFTDPANFRDYALIYYPDHNSLIAVWVLTSPGDVFYNEYFLSNGTFKGSAKIHDGGTGQGRGLDAKYSEYWNKIIVAWCGSDTGGTGIHLRYIDYNGTWANKYEWITYNPSYPQIQSQDQYIWIWAFPFPTLQDGWRINSNGGASWSTSFSYAGFQLNEEYFDSYAYNGSVYFTYCDDGPDKIYARKFTASQTPESNPPDIFYTPSAGSFSDMIKYDFNGTQATMAIYNLGDVKAFAGELSVINDYGFNGSSISDWASVDGQLRSGGATYTPPTGENGTCVYTYLTSNYGAVWTEDQIIEAIDYCENWTPPGEDPDDPDESGSWSTSRKQFKLYFLVLGIAFIAIPWLVFALTGDLKWIGYILLLNALGIGLLIEFMRL